MKNSNICIDNTFIGDGFSPYVIAEMSANHNGSIENAFQIIEEAKKAGASALKIQTYRPDTITLNCDADDFKILDGLWRGRTLYDLYQEAHMPWDWHKPLFDHARALEITIFSSPFDNTAIDLLEDLNAPAYKIASFEAIDLPLIKYAASTGKPLIISTGMASFEEIGEAVQAARDGGCVELAILHCVSAYPALAQDYHLQTIPHMIKNFGCVVGLSDHTLDNATAIASVSLGASIIEKHFTLDRNGGGPDDTFSILPSGLKQLCESVSTAWLALGSVNYSQKLSEQENIKFRRSLYFVRDMLKGEIITNDCIKSVRPGYGLPPKYYDEILGKTVTKDVNKNSPVSLDSIEMLAQAK
jgi:pseudaminic acid synthase